MFQLIAMLVDVHLYDALTRRAAFPIYERYGINRYELWMLSSLVGYLGHRGMTIVSKHGFFKFLTGNRSYRKKQEGYFHGLLSKGFIGQYEYIRVPGSQSIGLSDLGVRVIRDYLGSVQGLIDRHSHSNLISMALPETKYKRTA